jgi:uncharacterized protein (DUF488 family)
LKRSTELGGIEYRWLKSLGGRRHSRNTQSPHIAWENPAFRSYADYTETDEFKHGLEELCALAEQNRTAYMCSEGLWWRCHRRIISDQLMMRGWTVMHIMPNGKLSEHALPEFARVEEGRLIYDSNPPSLKGRG